MVRVVVMAMECGRGFFVLVGVHSLRWKWCVCVAVQCGGLGGQVPWSGSGSWVVGQSRWLQVVDWEVELAHGTWVVVEELAYGIWVVMELAHGTWVVVEGRFAAWWW